MISFRPATPDDIPLLRTLAQSIWHHAYPAIITREQIDIMLTRMYDPDTIRSELASGVVWKIIQENSTPIGYVSFSMTGPSECKAHKIYVLPDHHGRGIGRRCLEEAADYARAHNAKTLILLVNRKNEKALRAYRAFGFQVAESLDWEFSPGFILHDYKMELSISPATRRDRKTD